MSERSLDLTKFKNLKELQIVSRRQAPSLSINLNTHTIESLRVVPGIEIANLTVDRFPKLKLLHAHLDDKVLSYISSARTLETIQIHSTNENVEFLCSSNMSHLKSVSLIFTPLGKAPWERCTTSHETVHSLNVHINNPNNQNESKNLGDFFKFAFTYMPNIKSLTIREGLSGNTQNLTNIIKSFTHLNFLEIGTPNDSIITSIEQAAIISGWSFLRSNPPSSSGSRTVKILIKNTPHWIVIP